MLTEICLSGFKSWNEINDLRIGKITGLFGLNSSGKTSLLQWLLMLKQTVESPDRVQPLDLGNDRSLVELGTFRDILSWHKSDENLTWSIELELPQTLKITDPTNPNRVLFEGDRLTYGCLLREDHRMRPYVGVIAYGIDNNNFLYKEDNKKKKSYKISYEGSTGFDFKRASGRRWELPSPVKCYGFPDQVSAYFQNAGFLADFQLALEQWFARLYYLGPLREYPRRQYTWGGVQPADMGPRGENVVYALLSSRDRRKRISRGKGYKSLSLEEYVAHWLRELNLIHEFDVKPVTEGSNIYQVHVKLTSTSPSVLITDVGFGVSQILPVIALCYYVPEGSTIILEQPEIHLHPSAQAGLADVFIDAIKMRKIQIILESHSEHLLLRLQRRIAEEKLAPDDVALYFCHNDDGQSRLASLDVDEYGNIRNWPENFFGNEFEERAAMTRAALKRRMGSEL